MTDVQAVHVPAFISRTRRPGEFWWIASGGSFQGMAAACPCGCGAELRIYGLCGTPSYPSFGTVVQCSRGSQWTLRNGRWLHAADAPQRLPEPMF